MGARTQYNSEYPYNERGFNYDHAEPSWEFADGDEPQKQQDLIDEVRERLKENE